MDLGKDERWERVAPQGLEERDVYRAGAALSAVATGRRGQIIAATMRLIARDGVASLSTRKIAREADVNLATLHNLFGSKAAQKETTMTDLAIRPFRLRGCLAEVDIASKQSRKGPPR
jgi:AcrR family transcriptional regulator